MQVRGFALWPVLLSAYHILRRCSRIAARRSDITDADVIAGWKSAVAMRHRNFDPPAHIAAAGLDMKGRMIEMIGVELEDDGMLVYHAMKLTSKMTVELGLS